MPPSIAQAFSVTLPAAQQTLTVYLISFAFMTLFYGTLSDSFGRRPVILWSLVLYLLSSIGAGCANSLGWLLIFRFIQGLSAGAGSVVGRAIVGDLLSGAEAQRMMSYISVVFGLAPAVAPIIGGWLQAATGWRSIFYFIAFFALVLLLVCMRSLPESLPREKRHPFHFKVIVAHYWQVGRHARFMFRCLGGALAFCGVAIYVSSAPAFIIDLLHLSVKEFAWLFIPLIGGMTFGSVLTGRWSLTHTPAYIIRVGFAFMIIATLANVAYTTFFVVSVPWAVLPLCIYAIGLGIVMPAMAIMTLEMFPQVRGLASSLQGFVFMTLFVAV